jgi:hypothetical protein
MLRGGCRGGGAQGAFGCRTGITAAVTTHLGNRPPAATATAMRFRISSRPRTRSSGVSSTVPASSTSASAALIVSGSYKGFVSAVQPRFGQATARKRCTFLWRVHQPPAGCVVSVHASPHRLSSTGKRSLKFMWWHPHAPLRHDSCASGPRTLGSHPPRPATPRLGNKTIFTSSCPHTRTRLSPSCYSTLHRQ